MEAKVYTASFGYSLEPPRLKRTHLGINLRQMKLMSIIDDVLHKLRQLD